MEMHFIPRRNVIHKRAYFSQRRQMDRGCTEDFVTDLQRLAES